MNRKKRKLSLRDYINQIEEFEPQLAHNRRLRDDKGRFLTSESSKLTKSERRKLKQERARIRQLDRQQLEEELLAKEAENEALRRQLKEVKRTSGLDLIPHLDWKQKALQMAKQNRPRKTAVIYTIGTEATYRYDMNIRAWIRKYNELAEIIGEELNIEDITVKKFEDLNGQKYVGMSYSLASHALRDLLYDLTDSTHYKSKSDREYNNALLLYPLLEEIKDTRGMYDGTSHVDNDAIADYLMELWR